MKIENIKAIFITCTCTCICVCHCLVARFGGEQPYSCYRGVAETDAVQSDNRVSANLCLFSLREGCTEVSV